MDAITLANGTVLGVTKVGEGPVVLLNGGLGMPSMVWDICGLAPALADAGFTVISYNARGLAPSSAPPSPYSVADLADDAAALLGHFGVNDALVVGYSMGCYTTQAMLRSRPELVTAAVLFAGLQPSPIGALVGEMELSLIEQIGEIPRAVLVFEQLMTTLHTTLLQDPATVSGWRDMLSGSDGGWASPDGFTGQLAASYEWIKSGEPVPEHLAAIDLVGPGATLQRLVQRRDRAILHSQISRAADALDGDRRRETGEVVEGDRDVSAVRGVVAAEMEVAECEGGVHTLFAVAVDRVGRQRDVAARRQVDAGAGRRMPLVDPDGGELRVDRGELIDQFVGEPLLGARVARVVHERAHLFAELCVSRAATRRGDRGVRTEASLVGILDFGGGIVRVAHRSTV